MSDALDHPIGRVLPAPENHLNAAGLERARKARRSFMGKALAMGAGAIAATQAPRARAADGDPAILHLPAACTSSATTRVGGTSIPANTA